MTDGTDLAGAVEIDLAEPSPLWRRALAEPARVCERAARAALAGADAPRGPAELAVVLADDALVRALNRDWRGRDAPTNVLSFSARDGGPAPPDAPLLLGDVVLAFETVAAEAEAQKKPLADHLAHLVVHGVLHLLGFDHEVAAEARRMEALERRVLAGLGVADPYRPREASRG
ncbi:MAG TPA: rRNA maturation RNase YbeY [Stellaceae bacterium]|nr:rRNA maturation RNase YbeY [Stellaceae bacterium]